MGAVLGIVGSEDDAVMGLVVLEGASSQVHGRELLTHGLRQSPPVPEGIYLVAYCFDPNAAGLGQVVLALYGVGGATWALGNYVGTEVVGIEVAAGGTPAWQGTKDVLHQLLKAVGVQIEYLFLEGAVGFHDDFSWVIADRGTRGLPRHLGQMTSMSKPCPLR